MQNAAPQAFQRSPQQGWWVARPPPQQGAPRYPPQQPTGLRLNAPPPPAQPGPANRCFNYGSTAHFTHYCPQARQQNQGQNTGQQNKGKGKKQMVQVRQGRINYTTLTDLPEGAPVMMGIFSNHNHSAIILFDSRASHSFISAKFGAKVGLGFSHTKGSYMISTPGGKIASNQITR